MIATTGQPRTSGVARDSSLLTILITACRVSVSDDPGADQWEVVLSGTLPDGRHQPDPLPILRLELDLPVVERQFVKFEVLTHYGHGGGLEYFDIVRSSEPRLKRSVKRECREKTGDCEPRPQFCSSKKCISDTVTWSDSALPGILQAGCTYSAGDVYFADVSQQNCVSKKAAGGQSVVVDGVVEVDTADPSNLEPCSPWNETDACHRKFAFVQEKEEAINDPNIFTFKLSSDDCNDETEVSLELVDGSKEFNATGRYLKYKSLPDHQIELGGGEKCFKVSRNLCGPDSLSFFALSKPLVVTNCQGTLLMKTEQDNCG